MINQRNRFVFRGLRKVERKKQIDGFEGVFDEVRALLWSGIRIINVKARCVQGFFIFILKKHNYC